MAETIGKQLREEREKRGLSVDDVAHATRIHATNILGLEADDYSGFASTTYAKSFLKIYSDFLDVDATEALEQFAGGSAVGFGTGFIGEVTEKIEVGGQRDSYFSRSSSTPAPKPKTVKTGEQGGAPIFLGLILLLVMLAIPTFFFVGKDASSPEEALENARELSKGNLDSVVPASQGKATAVATEPAPATPRAPGPNPDVAVTQRPPVDNEPNPDIVIPSEPLVAKPVVIDPNADNPASGLPEPRELNPPKPQESIEEPATETTDKPKNRFGFPGD